MNHIQKNNTAMQSSLFKKTFPVFYKTKVLKIAVDKQEILGT